MSLPPDIIDAAWKKLVSGAPGAWITLHPAKNDEQKALLAEVLKGAVEETRRRDVKLIESHPLIVVDSGKINDV